MIVCAINTSHFVYLFICEGTFGLFSVFSYCEQSCYEHLGICVFNLFPILLSINLGMELFDHTAFFI